MYGFLPCTYFLKGTNLSLKISNKDIIMNINIKNLGKAGQTADNNLLGIFIGQTIKSAEMYNISITIFSKHRGS